MKVCLIADSNGNKISRKIWQSLGHLSSALNHKIYPKDSNVIEYELVPIRKINIEDFLKEKEFKKIEAKKKKEECRINNAKSKKLYEYIKLGKEFKA